MVSHVVEAAGVDVSHSLIPLSVCHSIEIMKTIQCIQVLSCLAVNCNVDICLHIAYLLSCFIILVHPKITNIVCCPNYCNL